MDPDSPSSPDQDKAPEQQQAGGLGKFWAELKRRKVVRVAVVYAVVAWLVIQIAATTFPSLYIPPWALSFVIMCVILGFPVALILAWAFELTPEGLKTTKAAQTAGANAEEHATHDKKRNWFSVIFAAAVPTLIFGTLALFFYIRSGSGPDFSDEDRSIAVLPFDNRSNLDEDQFFTDGIHDDLLTQISQIPDLKTIARTSVMVYRGTTKDMRTIGGELGVRTILEGGVQRAGNRIRINAQLIDAETNGHLWSDNFTRELTAENVFEIQDEITKTIAAALKVVLTPNEIEQLEKLPTENLAALEAYFKGKESRGLGSGSRTEWENALAHFEEAVSLDPDFALAHAMVGRSIVALIPRTGRPVNQEAAKAEPYIFKAIELDETLSDPYIALGWLRQRQGDLEAGEKALQKAVELDPNCAEAVFNYASFLGSIYGTATPELAELFRTSYKLDPKNKNAPDTLARSLVALGQWEEALKVRESFAAENPESADVLRVLGGFYQYQLGRFDDAVVTWRKQLALEPGTRTVNFRLSDAYNFLGDNEQALLWLDRYLKIQGESLLRFQRESWKFQLAEDEEARKQTVLQGLEKHPSDRQLLYYLTDIYIASGQLSNIRSRWQKAYPSLFEPSPEVEWKNRFEAKNVARVLMATGEMEQANRLIEEALVFAKADLSMWGYALEAELHAIGEDDRKALDAMHRFFEAGGSPYHLMLRDELKHFESHPEYQAMAQKRKAELAIQLNRIREMEANGELPPIPELPAN